MISDDRVCVELDDEASDHKVVVEDDGRVGYAYLLKDRTIIGDVWLYNRASPPEKVDPKTDELPLLNLSEYCDSEARSFEISTVVVTCDWKRSHDELLEVLLHFDGELMARLTPGSKPGWSRFARRDGPLAKVLVGTE